MEIRPSEVREILKISQEPVSLEMPIGEEEDSSLGDFIEDQKALAPADAASQQMLKEQMDDVLGYAFRARAGSSGNALRPGRRAQPHARGGRS